MISSPLFLLIWPGLGVAGTAFWVWTLIDCAKNEPKDATDRVFWIAIVALTSVLGASVYFFARRPERIRLTRGTALELE